VVFSIRLKWSIERLPDVKTDLVRTINTIGLKKKERQIVLTLSLTHNLGQLEVQTLVEMRREFHTSISIIQKFLAEDYSVEGVRALLQSREVIVKGRVEDSPFTPSLKWISALHKTFQDVPLDPELIHDVVLELCDMTDTMYADIAIRRVIQMAESLGTKLFEVAKDALEDAITEREGERFLARQWRYQNDVNIFSDDLRRPYPEEQE
jgi:hypothetical protein